MSRDICPLLPIVLSRISDICETGIAGNREYKVLTVTVVNFENWLDLVKKMLLSRMTRLEEKAKEYEQ